MSSNELFLTILPLIHTKTTQSTGFGLTEEVLTLMPNREFATQFFPDEVEGYIATFKNRAERYLVGGHVTGYECTLEPTENDRVIVRVIQHVR